MSRSTGDEAFYDRVAAKFGGYHSPGGSPIGNRFPGGSPERAFGELVRQLASSGATGLDVGCADGRNAIELAPLFTHLTGIDVSEGMLSSARQLREDRAVTNVDFQVADAEHTGFPGESFDFIYSRRGPTFYPEFARLLKPGGRYVEIQIGDRDARELKKLFGRGQDYGAWDVPFLERNVMNLRASGFTVIEAREYLYDDFYRDADHVSRFLEGVPIFTDYDATADRSLLERYIDQHREPEGVVLSRHRVLIAARKAG